MMSDNTQPYILVFGISICDIFGFTHTAYKAYDSNPGRVKMSYGGVCRNIAENMARIGLNTKLISVLGDDEKGKGVLENARELGFDMSHSHIVPGGSTPTYVAILDEKGEMVAAVVDIAITDSLTEAFVDTKKEIIEGACYTVLEADQPKMVEYMVKRYQGKTNFILDPVSSKKAATVKHLLPYFHTIKPNRYEAEALCGFALDTPDAVREAGMYFRGLGVKNVYISLDKDGIYYNSDAGEGTICAKDIAVVNVTGAGDSFVAGIGYGYTHGLDIKETVRFAITMSTITIGHEATIHPDMSYDFVCEASQKMVWEEVCYR